MFAAGVPGFWHLRFPFCTMGYDTTLVGNNSRTEGGTNLVAKNLSMERHALMSNGSIFVLYGDILFLWFISI